MKREDINILVGFEESGRVVDALIDRGFNAYSCDLVPTRGNNPAKHLQMDIFDAMRREKWHAMILHPPCTAMAVSGNRWYGEGMPKHDKRITAVNWTIRLWLVAYSVTSMYSGNAFVGLENPVGVLFPAMKEQLVWAKPDITYVQPYQFGHPETKKTGLALAGFKPLEPTNDVKDEMGGMTYAEKSKVHYMSPGPNRARDRSVTYQGIADAIAKQWGDELIEYFEE